MSNITRHDGLRSAVWNQIDAMIENAPCDGINAEGDKSERVADVQRAYIQGMRSARIAAMKIFDALDPKAK